MISFSRHLQRALLPGIVTVLLGSGLLIRFLVADSLIDEFDAALDSRARALMAITEQNKERVELEVFREALPGYFRTDSDAEYFEIRDGGGNVLFRSESLAVETPPLLLEATAVDDIASTHLPNGRLGRQIRRQYFANIDIDENHRPAVSVVAGENIPAPEQVEVTVAVSRAPLDLRIRQLDVTLLVTGLLTTLVITLLLTRTIRRAVKPIEHFTAQLGELDTDQLDTNLSIDNNIGEFANLGEHFNKLMGRLKTGFERERQFASDLAHEMRTPLAELRSVIEIMQRWPDNPEIKKTFGKDALTTVSRMERLTTTLLSMSREEQGLQAPDGLVDLMQLIKSVAMAHRQKLNDKSLLMDFDFPDEPNRKVVVRGDEHWRAILDNLIDNACEYSPRDSVVRMRLSVEGSGQFFTLAIDNPAPELEDADLPLLFDRLWRKDSARTSSRHSGLGLSLVQLYIIAVGATINARLIADENLSTARLCLEIVGSITDETDTLDSV